MDPVDAKTVLEIEFQGLHSDIMTCLELAKFCG